ncbi:MAG TPA: alpha-galactosidase [Chloroflexi bacterium]|nr:alpha-galactosidase [Chloroflexota bacterium]HHW86183.1 alpha-galactosidase [Chloroflexota bacterium]
MSSEWHLKHDELYCRVLWCNGQLSWQLRHPHAPAAQTHLAPVGDISVQGQSIEWTTLVGATETQDTQGAPRLTVTLEDSSGRLRLVRGFELFAGHAFVRSWGTVATTDADAPLIDGAAILHLAVARPTTLLHVEQFSWPYPKDFFCQRQIPLTPNIIPHEVRMGSFPAHYTAPTSCAWVALRDGAPDVDPETPGSGAGLVVGIEFNGKSRLRAWATDDAACLESRIDDLAHRLQPGEAFELPAFFVGAYHGDWDEAGYATQRFAEAHVHPPMPDDRYPWVQYNSWKYGQEINEAQQLAVLERCAELGIEVVVLDLGWARTIGDWRPNPEKFPRGLRPIAERAHELGMKFGVHVAIAQMAPDAPAAIAHPDWLAFGGDDYYGAGAICLGHKPCQEWLIEALVRLIEEERLDYIIQDGEDVVKRCLRDDHTHAPGDSNYANSTAGLDRVIMAVRRAHPQLVWENCEDGGCMMTYRMARLCHTSITVDNIATYATRQGIYGASYPFSPRYSVRYFEDEPTPYTLRSAIFGGPLILMQRIGEYDAQQMADAKAAIAQYKHLRTIIRGGKVIHLLPPRHNVEHHGRGWDAIQAVTPDQTRSVVMVYRALGGPDERTIRPRGLRAGATYTVSYADAGITVTRTAEDIQERGVRVALNELSSEVIELEAVNG